MTSVADRIAGPALADDAAPLPIGLVPTVSSAPVSGRELRLDLFRGLALWLIYIDHLPASLLTWLTIRNYGFSDATEIFIFISGYTAAFVYGRAMRDAGFVVATARILRRVWQIYVAHVFLFTIFLAEISYVATSFENPLYTEEMGILDFLKQPDITIVQALLLRFRPVNMDVLPLYIVLMLFLPLILLLMQWKADITLALSVLLYAVTWQYDLHLMAYPNGVWAFNPFAWQLLFVFGAWCAQGGARRMSRILSSRITLWISLAYLLAAFYVTLTWNITADEQLAAALARAVDVSDQQDRPGRVEVRAFPGAGGCDRALPSQGLARAEIAVAAAADPVRAAFAGNLLHRRVPGICRALRAGRGLRRRRVPYRAACLRQRGRNSHHVGSRVADFVVQAFRR